MSDPIDTLDDTLSLMKEVRMKKKEDVSTGDIKKIIKNLEKQKDTAIELVGAHLMVLNHVTDEMEEVLEHIQKV